MRPNFDRAALTSFIAVAESGSFTHAAEGVGRTQSAVSLQIRKLEEMLGCPLFVRTTRHVRLTEQGELFLGYAKRIAQLEWEAFSRLKEPEIEGEIRLGTPEDFATHYLPEALASFREHHPRVLLHVRCDLTLNLLSGFRQGEYDVVLVKCDPQSVKGGTKVWREPLIWAAANRYAPERPLSLVLAPQPCIYRARALAALDRARLPWHITYTSPSFAGTLAAVKAGLGITVMPATMLPAGVHALRPTFKLPSLADAEMALLRRDGLSKAGERLVEHIVHRLEAL